MRGACVDIITELVDRCSAAGRCDMVHDIARQYPVPIIIALVGAPRNNWELFALPGRDLVRKAFGDDAAAEETAILQALGDNSTRISRNCSRQRRHTLHRRSDLPADSH